MTERNPGRCLRFTLLELMVAMTVFVLLVGVLAAFSREVAKSYARLNREQQRFSELLVLDRALDNLLTNLIPFQWKDEDGDPLPVFVGEPERVQFATLHRLNDVAEGALRFVELAVEDGELIAVYQDRPFAIESSGEETAFLSVLARGVERIEFRYADMDGDDALLWTDEWEPERKTLPLAVMLIVHWDDGRVESWLRRTAGAGFRERWGKWQPKR